MQTPVCVPIVSTRSQVYGNTRARVGGLKGRRVGEARNPGPAKDQPDPTANEFMEVVSALEFDLTQLDSDHDLNGSETESCAEDPLPANGNAIRDRRLTLIWSQEWHPDARTAGCMVRELGNRIGNVSTESPVPRAVRQQRWCPLNVPLMWAATKRSDTTPVLQWLSQAGSRIVEPIEFHESHISATDAATVGWTALRAVMRSWEIHEREHLTDWLRRQGFPAVQPGNHISAHAQEFLLSETCRANS